MESVDKLLNEVENASAGRRALDYWTNDAKELTTLAGDLALACHRFRTDESVSPAAIACEESVERYLSEATFIARRGLLDAIGCVQTAHLAARLKARAEGRGDV